MIARRRRSARGFTLIEILMTIAITALVFAMIGGILVSVLQAGEGIEEKLRTEKAGHGVLSVLRRDLTGVYAYALGGPAFRGEDRTELGRDADVLHFVSASATLDDGSGRRPKLVEVGYRLGPGTDDRVLVLYRRAVPLSGDPLASSEPYTELYGQVHSFDVEYLDAERGDWQDRWEEEGRLPQAVRIRLELALTESQRIAVDQGLIDVPPPRYEMVVGLPTSAGPPPEEEAAPGGP